MQAFLEFLNQRLEGGGGFSTEEVLVAFLPLARQVADLHVRGKVAPLIGVDDLHVEASRIYFEAARARSSLHEPYLIEQP